jgi:hypothetical protein
MSPSILRRRARPILEILEDRLNPSPTFLTNVALPGANSNWDNFYSHGPYNASPITADIHGNGTQDVFVTGGDANLYAYQLVNGQMVIDKTYLTGRPGDFLQGSPVVVNVPGVGLCVFIGTSQGVVLGWNVQTQAMLPGWPVNTDPGAASGLNVGDIKGVYGGAAAGDLTGNGFPNIVVSSANHETTAFNVNGSVLWRFNNDDTITTTPVIADINGDGRNEVIIGGDSSPSSAYWTGGRIQAISGDGHRMWVKEIDNQVIQSSPVVADMFGNGKLEIFVGTGLVYPVGPTGGNFIYGLDNNGNTLPGWPVRTEPDNVDGRVQSSPAVADLLGNGQLEVLAADSQAHLFAIQANGQPLWTVSIGASPLAIFGTPIVADVNNDGKPDVFISDGHGVNYAFNGATGALLWQQSDPAPAPPSFNSYAVAPLKASGSYQLVEVADSLDMQGPGGHVLSPSIMEVYDLGASTLTPPWSQFRQDGFGNAVTRPLPTVTALITHLYQGALGRNPSSDELSNTWVPATLHAGSLRPVDGGIIMSTEARTLQINGWYEAYLGRGAEPAGLAIWLGALANGTSDAIVQAAIAGSLEAFIHSGNTIPSFVTFLYQQFLKRPPVGTEDAYWINSLTTGSLTQQQVALSFILTPESTNTLVLTWYQTYAPGGLTFPPQDSIAAMGRDLRRGDSTEQVLLNLLASYGDYITTQVEGATIRASYPDLLGRSISVGEMAFWEQHLETGTTIGQIDQIVVGSTEAHQHEVLGFYQKYLGRGASPGEMAPFVSQLDSGANATQVQQAIVQSGEYFGQPSVAGDPTKYITKLLSDLLDRAPLPGEIANFLNLSNNGATVRTVVPSIILHAPEFSQHTVDVIFFHVLRRWGQTPSDLSRVLANPSVFPPQSLADFLTGGGNVDAVWTTVLESPEYAGVDLNKSFWGGTRWLDDRHP